MNGEPVAPGGFGPHAGRQPLGQGTPLHEAPVAVVMLHGRGAAATDILALADAFDQPGIAYLAPEAVGNTWYPYRFLEPLERNEPYLSSALSVVAATVALATTAGIPHERIVLLGFSQGACLATEYAARHARRYGGVIGFSGGLIGPDGTPRDYPGSLDGTPVFLGCSDVDAHIPLARVQHTTTILRRLGGDVTERIYPGMAHTVSPDEIKHARAMLSRLLAAAGMTHASGLPRPRTTTDFGDPTA